MLARDANIYYYFDLFIIISMNLIDAHDQVVVNFLSNSCEILVFPALESASGIFTYCNYICSI